MTDLEKTKLSDDAKRIANWLSVDFTVSIFGHVILRFHYPPKNS